MCPPGCSAPARKRLILGALCRCTPKGLAKIRGFGEADSRQTEQLPGNRTMQTRPSRRVLLFRVLGLAVLREQPRRIARTAQAWRNNFQAATGKVEIIGARWRFRFRSYRVSG